MPSLNPPRNSPGHPVPEHLLATSNRTLYPGDSAVLPIKEVELCEGLVQGGHLFVCEDVEIVIGGRLTHCHILGQ
jgi:hypothetical protein